jgi:hypothetical protein
MAPVIPTVSNSHQLVFFLTKNLKVIYKSEWQDFKIYLNKKEISMIDLSFSLVGQIIITIICKVYLKL